MYNTNFTYTLDVPYRPYNRDDTNNSGISAYRYNVYNING